MSKVLSVSDVLDLFPRAISCLPQKCTVCSIDIINFLVDSVHLGRRLLTLRNGIADATNIMDTILVEIK